MGVRTGTTTARGQGLGDRVAQPFAHGKGQSWVLPLLFLSHAWHWVSRGARGCKGGVEGVGTEGTENPGQQVPSPNHPGTAPAQSQEFHIPATQCNTYRGCQEAQGWWQKAVASQHRARVGHQGLGRPPQGSPGSCTAPQLSAWAPLTLSCHAAGREARELLLGIL